MKTRIMMLLLFSFSMGVSAAEEGAALGELQGVVDSVDTPSNVMTVKDTTGKSWPLRVEPATRILDSGNKVQKPDVLQTHPHVHVYYNTFNGVARQIDLVSSSETKILTN